MAKLLEDYIQEKNRSVTGVVFSPDFDVYPSGKIDTINLPASFTWLQDSMVDSQGTIRDNTFLVEVYVQHVAQDIFASIKKKCRTLLELFSIEYTIISPNLSATNGFLRDNPAAYIVPGSVKFSGVRNLITAYDDTEVHGFTFTLDVREHLDRDCS